MPKPEVTQRNIPLPLLDLREMNGNEAGRQAFLERLRRAARDVGFFYLAGHGVPASLVEEVMLQCRGFFALSDAEKAAVAMIHSPHFKGYNRSGQELTRGKPDWREQFDIHAERPILPDDPDGPAWARLQGPNLWPVSQPGFRAALLEWQAALTGVATRLVACFAEALGQAPDALNSICEPSPHQAIKISRYPGQTQEREQGVGAHKDSELLTLLLQDEVGGLQVQLDGRWIDAIPVPGTFVVNIGELLELASNGHLRATVHRVTSPAPGSERLSVAFFLGARLDATVPLLALPPVLAAEAAGPATDPLNPLLRNVGDNYLKGRLRSHPDVAARHYADFERKPGNASNAVINAVERPNDIPSYRT